MKSRTLPYRLSVRKLISRCVLREGRNRTHMKNQILQALTSKERGRLLAQLSLINLSRSTVLFEPGDTPEYIYFPLEAMVSYLSSTSDGQSIEVGLVGNEGVVGIATLF